MLSQKKKSGFGRFSEGTVGFRELTAQFCVRKSIGKDISEAFAIACQNYAVYSVFHQVWRHTVKSFSLTEIVYGA
jgi:hypothetical protein